MLIDDKYVIRIGKSKMATTLSTKFQIVIPKAVREKLHLAPKQRFQVVERGRVITLIPELPLRSLKGTIRGLNGKNIREKKDRI